MTEQEAQAEEPLRMSAYYYSFEPTGVIQIDRILSAVARAGKAYHHTEQWDDDAYGGLGSPVEWIQDAANGAALAWQASRKPVAAPSDTDREALARAMYARSIHNAGVGSHVCTFDALPSYSQDLWLADAGAILQTFSRTSQPAPAPSDTDREALYELHFAAVSQTGYMSEEGFNRAIAAIRRASQPVQVEVTDRPEIVVLCGSTRFYDEFQEANYDLTMEGKIVLSVGFYPHAKAKHGHGEGVGHDSAEKVALDELHKRKIDLADRVLVLNVGGYIGESTRGEIDYAKGLGKPIDYLSAALGGEQS